MRSLQKSPPPNKEVQKMDYKTKKKTIILAHNYQPLKVQKYADYVGDSFQLAKIAANVKCDIILFCGVRFMAETAKLLNPTVKVLLSAADAGCPMADMANYNDVKLFKENHPQHLIVSYVNSSIEVKALSDVCVTSSNAVNIVNKLPKHKKIMFIPDQNLGHYVRKLTKRDIELWDGFCPIHNIFITIDDIKNARLYYPDHHIIVHPECAPEVVDEADFVGSTSQIADFTQTHDKVVIGTDCGLINMLIDKYPDKSIVPLSDKALCKNMNKTDMDIVLDTLKYEKNEIIIPDDIAKMAMKPILKMMELN